MAKVLCINSKPIRATDGSVATGDGLIEGVKYTATDRFKNKFGDQVYFIEELNEAKMCVRFRVVEDDFEENVLRMISQSNEELSLG